MATFPLSIITPNGVSFKQEAQFISAPGVEGSFGVLARHAPFITLLLKGVVKVIFPPATKFSSGDQEKAHSTGPEETKFFAINEGILEVNGKGDVLLLANYAAPYDDATKAEAALKTLA